MLHRHTPVTPFDWQNPQGNTHKPQSQSLAAAVRSSSRGTGDREATTLACAAGICRPPHSSRHVKRTTAAHHSQTLGVTPATTSCAATPTWHLALHTLDLNQPQVRRAQVMRAGAASMGTVHKPQACLQRNNALLKPRELKAGLQKFLLNTHKPWYIEASH